MYRRYKVTARGLTPGCVPTSTEPCAMCASAIYHVDLDRMVYSVSQPAFVEGINCDGIELRCETVFERAFGPAQIVEGSIRKAKELEIHQRFDY